MEVLTSFEKVDPSKVRFFDWALLKEEGGRVAHERVMQVTVTSSFTNDLGLDSLDAVEVVMAIEGELWPVGLPSPPTDALPLSSAEEFSIEIPDEEADRITTVAEGELEWQERWDRS